MPQRNRAACFPAWSQNEPSFTTVERTIHDDREVCQKKQATVLLRSDNRSNDSQHDADLGNEALERCVLMRVRCRSRVQDLHNLAALVVATLVVAALLAE